MQLDESLVDSLYIKKKTSLSICKKINKLTKLDTSPFTLSNSNVLKLNLGQFEEHSHYFCPAPYVKVVKSVAGHLLSPV